MCLECHRIKFLNEILSPNAQRYCLRHDSYYSDDTHGASCFRKKDEVTPIVKSIESFKFTGPSHPPVVPNQTRVRDLAVTETPAYKGLRTWVQAVSVCLP